MSISVPRPARIDRAGRQAFGYPWHEHRTMDRVLADERHALPPDWQQRDGAGSFYVAIAEIREMYKAGWRPEGGSPFRPRNE